jgi:hypothetical protein
MGCFVDGSQEAETMANVVKMLANVMALCIGIVYVRYMTSGGF